MNVLAQNIALSRATMDRGARISVRGHLTRASSVDGVVLLAIDFHARIDLNLNVKVPLPSGALLFTNEPCSWEPLPHGTNTSLIF